MNFTPESTDQLQKLANLYGEVKLLVLYSEEVDRDSQSNIQVIKEFRDAFDHLMRAIIATTRNRVPDNANSKTLDQYSVQNIDKAIGHVYRAAFDSLDGTVLSLKNSIHEDLGKYPLDVIKEVITDYWEMKIKILELQDNIATHRNRKDIGNDINAEVFRNYVRDIETLKMFYKTICSAGPALDEAHSVYKRNQYIKYTFLFLTAIGAISALVALLK